MKLQIFILLVLIVVLPAIAQDNITSREQLNRYVTDLQKSPDDQALLERIIKLASTLDPKPAIPEEARRHFVKAVTLQKEANKPNDYDFASKEYNAALLLAPPWLASTGSCEDCPLWGSTGPRPAGILLI